MATTGFAGFPSGKNPYVPIPEVFFTRLLPEIEGSTELKVTLHLFWLLAQKKGNPRCVGERELLEDQRLLHGLKRRGDPRPAEERLRLGLDQAVARGTLLRIHLNVVTEGGEQIETLAWYFFNTARSRKAVKELQGGEMVPVRLLISQADQEAQENNQSLGGEEYSTSRGYNPESAASAGFRLTRDQQPGGLVCRSVKCRRRGHGRRERPKPGQPAELSASFQ